MRFSLLLTSALAFLMASAFASESPCPEHLRGSLRAGQYTFEYDSLYSYSKEKEVYLLRDCIRNLAKSTPLFFSWAGLMGFVDPNDVAWLHSSHSTDRNITKKVPLWYGAAPSKLDVETVFPDDKDQHADRNSIRVIPAALSNANELHLNTQARINILLINEQDRGICPGCLDNRQPEPPVEEITRAVERRNARLTPFEMTFDSYALTSLLNDPDISEITSISYHCEYKIGSNPEATDTHLFVTFSDQPPEPGRHYDNGELAKIIFKEIAGFAGWLHAFASVNPEFAGKHTPSGGFEWKAEVPNLRLAKDELVRKNSWMTVVTSHGAVLASIPITYFDRKLDIGTHP